MKGNRHQSERGQSERQGTRKYKVRDTYSWWFLLPFVVSEFRLVNDLFLRCQIRSGKEIYPTDLVSWTKYVEGKNCTQLEHGMSDGAVWEVQICN